MYSLLFICSILYVSHVPLFLPPPTHRLTYLLKTLVRSGRHVLLIGPSGTGKTGKSMIHYFFLPHFLIFSFSSSFDHRYTYIIDFLCMIFDSNFFLFLFPPSPSPSPSVLVNDYLSSLAVEDSNYRYAMINMNYYTDSASLQVLILLI